MLIVGVSKQAMAVLKSESVPLQLKHVTGQHTLVKSASTHLIGRFFFLISDVHMFFSEG